LVLVHAPSVYDFRRKGFFYGPTSDVIPSTPVFEMYPIGFMTMASMLAKRGYKVRILNLASMMLADDSLNVENLLASIRSRVYGIDLHWLPHAHGSLEVAKMIKSQHPNSKLIFGGFSSTYFWKEMMENYPIDAVFLGDSTEKPLMAYFRALDKKGAPRKNAMDRIPNLVHRRSGRIINNGLKYVPDHLDDIDFDYGWMVRNVIKTMDLDGHIPYLDWKRHPMSLVATVRGCVYGCVTCMGSCQSFKGNFGRTRPAYRSPEKVVEDIHLADSYLRGTIFLLGDLQQPGKKYYNELFRLLRKDRPRNDIAVEFFVPPPKGLIQNLGRTLDSFDSQISPDTHDEVVRKAQGRHYSNHDLERSISGLVKAGARRVDVFNMIGLPKQDFRSVMNTVKYSKNLMNYHKKHGKVTCFIAPLAPFIDPGSQAFEHPYKMGYKIHATTLEEHRDLLLQPTWKQVLNYETEWLSRDGLVEATYESALAMNQAKLAVGLIDEETANRVEFRTRKAIEIMDLVDLAIQNNTLPKAMASIRDDMLNISESSINDKRELDWSNRSFYWSIPRSMGAILMGK